MGTPAANAVVEAQTSSFAAETLPQAAGEPLPQGAP